MTDKILKRFDKNIDDNYKDDYGNDYEILDIEAFKNHIEKYHSSNGKGDGSIHERKRVLV